ncbi:Uncharacterized protein TCM_005500 [Theobroma cacao]|uniref:Uncharacterized protein n=1 Tax=Theobroma cacao TaxID=3641 RepID=A0A061DU19_THECC|nr:Uncharacterized protein TCM_005500 [Theobroma cacao]
MDLVCLAHQVVEDGQDCFPDTSQPVTILSAPNYCGEFDNAGQLGRLDCWTHNIFSCEGQRVLCFLVGGHNVAGVENALGLK